jgi:hypothetical protein
MSQPDAVRVFNEWMRRYILNPELFAREIESVRLFQIDDEIAEPSYGRTCAANRVS